MRKVLTVNYIVAYVAQAYMTTIEAVRSSSQEHKNVMARSVAAMLIKKHLHMTNQDIGNCLNRAKDTIRHNIKTVDSYKNSDKHFAQRLYSLEQEMLEC